MKKTFCDYCVRLRFISWRYGCCDLALRVFLTRPIMDGVSYGGMGRAKLTEFKALEKENQRLKKILAELELDKLILKESLDYLKPRA